MSTRKKLYRSRDGLILGVCKGIAEWREFPVELVRLVFILLVVLAGMSIWIYFILALIFPLEPRYGKDRRNHYSKNMDEEYEELKKEYRKMADDINKERDWENRFSKKS
ncbi:hypothetical protein S1OALGB6SA_571 [Olavius algarvensis spirochete endosymbiont]|uniref:PspC domain-containing protein n=1 Tax=Olavius algarvensis spirochete endosymbiont TaxID=260710 RepID=UPI000F1AB8B4|nr:PspC domain-containing protein [Olavius algarvensis spirochete endosymbiont]CAD7838644.1 MAG: hypothetical protein [Olavius algarvensis spirochete endosymbiont]VDA99503.1 hypothetical protein S1OALGB6SA_571 [Olavius algarvensis spirochete endosymbiont]